MIKLTPTAAFESRKNLALRFAIASDGHYGENGTAFDASFRTLIQHVTSFHSGNKLDFCVINGDIIHDQTNLLTQAKSHLDKLPVKYYVAKGNHDKVSDDHWEEVWGMPVNHEVVLRKNTFLLATTSDESGNYLSPDLDWLGSKLDKNKLQENVFLFLHIPQGKWTANAIETPAFFDLLKKYKNIRAVFHGHEHDKDDIRIHENIPFMFDSHFGGSWGTSYKGFRVVELARDNSLVTYIMNPSEKINQAAF